MNIAERLEELQKQLEEQDRHFAAAAALAAEMPNVLVEIPASILREIEDAATPQHSCSSLLPATGLRA